MGERVWVWSREGNRLFVAAAAKAVGTTPIGDLHKSKCSAQDRKKRL